jgi:hypothetical protein
MSYKEKLTKWIKNEVKHNGLIKIHIDLSHKSNHFEDVYKSVLSALDNESRGEYILLKNNR